MVEGGFLQRGGGWVVLQNLLCIGVLVAAPVPSGRWMNASPVPAILGGFLVLAGAWFGIGGVRALGLNRTPYPQPLLKSQLVTRGVYQWLRHPLYASLIYLGVGWALLWASWAGLIGAGVLTVLLFAKSLREERWMRERYPDYRGYQKRVRRFIPGVF